MARNIREKAKAQTAEGGFIECELDESERAACREWVKTTEEIFDWLQQLTDDNYVLKVSYEAKNDCYAAYVSGHWERNKPDAKWTLSGRGSTVGHACRQALFKHFVILGGDWSTHKTGVKRERNWD